MDNSNFSRELSESIADFEKIVKIIFLVKNDNDLLKECGFLNSDIIRLKKRI